MKKKLTNVGASVRAKILKLSKDQKEENLHLLERYCLERLLYRLSRSAHKHRFILKGAMLFLVWRGSLHRMTRDVDLLGSGDASLDHLREVLAEVCTVPVDDDGVVFLPQTIRSEEIRPEDEYVGVRLHVDARVENALIRLQVDVGFGDAMTVSAVEVTFPSLLGFPAPILRAYSAETVIAEKFEAAVKLGMVNTRLKDYYDIWFLAKHFDFKLTPLADAIEATMKRRRTALPDEIPTVFQGQFGSDHEKAAQWKTFWKKAIRSTPIPELSEVVDFIAAFLEPVIRAAHDTKHDELFWKSGGPWGPVESD